MKPSLKDILIIILSIVSLYLLFELSRNGRYQSISEGMILDTRNAKVYKVERNGNNNPESGPIWKWAILSEEIN